MKLYLHAGTHKTATSYLQSIIRDNRDLLRDHGIMIPHAGMAPVGAHHKLADYFWKSSSVSDPATEDFHNLMTELDNAGQDVRAVLITSEKFSSFRKLDPDRLAQFFDHFTSVELLLYVREQTDYLLSRYNSILVSGGTAVKDFEHFCRTHSLDYY